MTTKRFRIGLAALGLAVAAAGGAGIAYFGSDGRLGYTEPRGNPSPTPLRGDPSITPSRAGAFALAAPAERREAPGFVFADASGQPLRLANLKGRVLLVNLWASWCPPCIAEMPDLDAVQRRLGGERFQVVAVSLDRGGIDQARRWLERNEITALTAYAADVAQFGNAALPTSLLLDRTGRVAWHGAGMRAWNGAEADAAIQALLAE